MNYDDPTTMPTAPINGPAKTDKQFTGAAGLRRNNPIPVTSTTAPLSASGMNPVKRKSAKKLF